MHWSNVLRSLSILVMVAVVGFIAEMDLVALASSQPHHKQAPHPILLEWERVETLLTLKMESSLDLNTSDHRSYIVNESSLGTAVRIPMLPSREIELELSKGQRHQSIETIRATRGEWLELRWHSEHSVVLHLHGYDIEGRSEPNSDGRMVFQAILEGRFALETHAEAGAEEEVVAYLEVYPK